jgi:hypothetical protein
MEGSLIDIIINKKPFPSPREIVGNFTTGMALASGNLTAANNINTQQEKREARGEGKVRSLDTATPGSPSSRPPPVYSAPAYPREESNRYRGTPPEQPNPRTYAMSQMHQDHLARQEDLRERRYQQLRHARISSPDIHGTRSGSYQRPIQIGSRGAYPNRYFSPNSSRDYRLFPRVSASSANSRISPAT